MAVPQNHRFNTEHVDDCLTNQDIINRTDKYYQSKSFPITTFNGFTLLTLGAHDCSSQILQKLYEAENITPHTAFESHNLNIMFQWIIAGYGIGLIPDTQIRFNNYQIHPYYYKISDPDNYFGITQSQIVVASAPHHYLSKAVREYLHMLHESVSLGDWYLNSNS